MKKKSLSGFCFVHMRQFDSKNQIGELILVTPKQEVKWSEGFCGVKFISPEF